jgi:DNA polymerase/3'-5' exonuclease PolX
MLLDATGGGRSVQGGWCAQSPAVFDRLREIPGVGVALEETILRIHKDGTTSRLDAMRAEVPAGVLEMLAVPGLRPPRVLDLFRKLGIASLDDLDAAGRQNKLAQAKGFGPAFQAKVLAGIELLRRSRGQRLIHHAAERLEVLETRLVRRSLNGSTRAPLASTAERPRGGAWGHLVFDSSETFILLKHG